MHGMYHGGAARSAGRSHGRGSFTDWVWSGSRTRNGALKSEKERGGAHDLEIAGLCVCRGENGRR